MGRGRRAQGGRTPRTGGEELALDSTIADWVARRMNGYGVHDLVAHGLDAADARELLDGLALSGGLIREWEAYCSDCAHGVEVLAELPADPFEQRFLQCPHVARLAPEDLTPVYTPRPGLVAAELRRDVLRRLRLRPSSLAA